MSELIEKIEKILSSKTDIDWNRVKTELSYFENINVLEDIYVLYKKTSENNCPGNLNPFNSAVLYFLGITNAKYDDSKPINVPKRRTYGRDGFPDVDMDFDYERRHEIMEYLNEKYGRDYVGNIGTIQTLKTKNAVRRVIKMLDPENSVVFNKDGSKIKDERKNNIELENRILDTLPELMKKADGTNIKNIKEAYEEYSEFRRYMDQYPEIMRIASRLEGKISASGVHAAGVVLSPIELKYICPMHVTRGNDSSPDAVDAGRVLATQFAMADVESLGLIKFDILGLSTKTAIDKTIKLIKERYNLDLDLSKIPLDDKKTIELLRSGKTDLCFQLENHGMKESLRQISVDSFEDLVVAIAMYRPGPKDYIPLYAKRKKGIEKVTYYHPIVKDILSSTQGIVVYQESCMQVFMRMAGLSNTDGYKFLKGCAKKHPEIVEQYKNLFIQGCVNNGVEKPVADKVFKDLERFSGYAFNRAHAVSYALESWKTAFLKAHYPTEFFAARLSVELKRRRFTEVEKYEKDAINNFNIKLLPPSLNKSKIHYVISGESELIRPFLSKGVGLKAAEEIVKNQPYKGADLFFNFVTRAGKNISTKVMEQLWKDGIWGNVKKDKILNDFDGIRRGMRSAKGKPLGDMFG